MLPVLAGLAPGRLAPTAIVGGVLIAIDLTVLRRKRQELARVPWVVPGIGSLVIGGRF